MCGRVRKARIFELAVVALAFAWPAVPAGADPIIASHQGCVRELPPGGASWTSTDHFQFVAFWDPVAGCDPTIRFPMVVHEWFADFDDMGGLMTATRADWFPTCGRIQFDAQDYLDGPAVSLNPLGLVSLVFDTGVDCHQQPELIRTSRDGTPGKVPEPALPLLVGGGVCLAAARRRWRW